jgi:hypothetical protein
MYTKCIHIPDKSGQPGLQKLRMMLLNCRHLANGLVAKALKDLQPESIRQIRHFHEEEPAAEDLVQKDTPTILLEEVEEDEPAPVDLLTSPKLQKTLKMYD